MAKAGDDHPEVMRDNTPTAKAPEILKTPERFTCFIGHIVLVWLFDNIRFVSLLVIVVKKDRPFPSWSCQDGRRNLRGHWQSYFSYGRTGGGRPWPTLDPFNCEREHNGALKGFGDRECSFWRNDVMFLPNTPSQENPPIPGFKPLDRLTFDPPLWKATHMMVRTTHSQCFG